MKTSTGKMTIVILLTAGLLGCSGGGNNSASTGSGAAVSFQLIDPPINSNDQSGNTNGKKFILVANRQGDSSDISGYEVVLQSAYADGTQKISTFETTSGTKVGAAYSGTPVFTSDGTVAWVLFGGYSGTPTIFVARDINEMLPLLDQNTWGIFPPSTSKLLPLALGTDMKTPWCARGLNSKFINDYKGQVQNQILFANQSLRSTFKSLASSNSGSGQLMPGSTIAIKLVEGDTVNLYSTGTLSYTKDGKRWLAFGHAMDQMGLRNLPVSEVFTNSTIDAGTWGTFKDSYPVGPTIGTLVYDTYRGIVIDTDKVPETTPVTVKVTMDGHSMTWSHTVARDNGSWLELYGLNAAIYGPLYTLNDITGSFSISGKLTIGVDGQAPEEVPVDNTSQNNYIFSNYSTHSFGDSLYMFRSNISNAINSKTKAGKPFTSLNLEVNVSKN